MLFHVEAIVIPGLTNLAYTTKSCEWLLNRKDMQPAKVKYLSFFRYNFGKRGKKSRHLVNTQKKL